MEQSLAVVEPSVTLDPAVLRNTFAANATEKEFMQFLHISKAYGLNPFKREVYFIKYGSTPGQVIVGYETYLKRAERSGQLDGWHVRIIDKGKPEERAEITIHRKDQEKPFVWEVYREEFDTKKSLWAKMPSHMLRKVAIAQGMRLFFPVEVGGLPYTQEEMGSESLPVEPVIEAEVTVSKAIPAPKPVSQEDKPWSPAQRGRIAVELREAGLNNDQMVDFIHQHAPNKSVKEGIAILDNLSSLVAAFKASVPSPTPKPAPENEDFFE